MEIGYYGDSFCASKAGGTYIDLVAKQLNATTTHLGHVGSGVHDLWLNQLKPQIDSKTLPDVIVCVWTGPDRLYHPHIRNINASSVLGTRHWTDRAVWAAARDYYAYLHDYEKTELEYLSFLTYADQVLLQQIPAKHKIIHLWSFGLPSRHDSELGWADGNIKYHYDFTRGIEIRPPLMKWALEHVSLSEFPNRPQFNHIADLEANRDIADQIVSAIN